ncbi:MAG: phosphate regulon sensor histidine kinase PhoR [Pseudomonadales bacterium]
MSLLPSERVLAALLVIGAIIAGTLTDTLGWTGLGAALIWIALQHREFLELRRFSREPLSSPNFHLRGWMSAGDRMLRQVRMARRRTRRTLALSRALQRMTAALPDAAIMVDAHGRIEQLNAAAEHMLGLRRGDRGGYLASLVRQPDFAVLVRGRSDAGIVEFPSPFDDQLRLEARRINMEAGRSLILVRDVTQLNRLLTMRQDFGANVSHELRTPLTVIAGYLEALAEGDVDLAMSRRLVKRLEAPTQRMRALVDDLLLLSRLEANPPPSDADLRPVDMPRQLEACLSEARMLSDDKHRFSTSIDRTLWLRAVDHELHSAALNLLSNAVRYSPDGGDITVSWGRLPSGAARLAVQDQGIGIAPEHLTRITERFYRVDLARSRIAGGTGLGLAIVKHVLKRHRSQLQVQSQPGKGSTFFCDFDRTLVANPPPASHPLIENQEHSRHL